MNKPHPSDVLALDELYTALCSVRRSDVLGGTDLDFDLSESLYAGLIVLLGKDRAGRVLGTLNTRPAATLAEVVTEILEEA